MTEKYVPSDKFNQFVEEHLKKNESALNLTQELDQWRNMLDQLYNLVETSLAPQIEAGQMQFKRFNIQLDEEMLGSYTVEEGRITLGREVVKLVPIGTFLIGSRGRVDMIGPRGISRFTIVPPDSQGIRVHVEILEPGQTKSSQPDIAPPLTWIWKIATPPPRIKYIDLNEETFLDALIGVING